jgi:hypothetical protein
MEKIRRNLSRDISMPLGAIKITKKPSQSIDEIRSFSNTEFEKILNNDLSDILKHECDVSLLSACLKIITKQCQKKQFDENRPVRLKQNQGIKYELSSAKTSLNQANQEYYIDLSARDTLADVLDSKCTAKHGIQVLNKLRADYIKICKNLKNEIMELENNKNKLLPDILEEVELVKNGEVEKLQKLIIDINALDKEYYRYISKIQLFSKLILKLRLSSK